MTITQYILIGSAAWITLSAVCAGLYAIAGVRYNKRMAAQRQRHHSATITKFPNLTAPTPPGQS
jgi:hypothetical protein